MSTQTNEQTNKQIENISKHWSIHLHHFVYLNSLLYTFCNEPEEEMLKSSTAHIGRSASFQNDSHHIDDDPIAWNVENKFNIQSAIAIGV